MKNWLYSFTGTNGDGTFPQAGVIVDAQGTIYGTTSEGGDLTGPVFYDDGCVAGQSLVTTGRPGLRTPTGTFHIYAKFSPITFSSQWPTSSPYYFAPEKASYGMEFRGGGFFIHDAPWEPSSGFGPGSENGADASHGCVHMPTPTMQWLYSWSPIGTTVIIRA